MNFSFSELSDSGFCTHVEFDIRDYMREDVFGFKEYLNKYEIIELVAGLALNNSIKKVYFNGFWRLGDEREFLEYLTKGLVFNQTIEEISFRDCRIDLEGLRCIIEWLKVNKIIKKIDLSDNSFNDADGFNLLIELLNVNSTLKEINLQEYEFLR